MQIPSRWHGSGGSLGAWLDKLLDFAKASEVVSGAGYRVSRGPRGTVLQMDDRGKGGSSVQQFRLVSIQNDFYTCNTWDGSTAGSAEVYIARPFEHRMSNFNGRTIVYSSDGDSFSASFSYTSATKRTKTIAGVAETQVLVPYFVADFTIIYATEVDSALTVGASNTPLTDPNDSPITLLDLNLDGRAWAKV